jgi:hypothetical protein
VTLMSALDLFGSRMWSDSRGGFRGFSAWVSLLWWGIGSLEAKFGEITLFSVSSTLTQHASDSIIGGLATFVNALLVLDCSCSNLVRDWTP